MMNCQQATRLLSDAQENPLSLKERTALRLHVMMCSGCRNFSKQIGTLRDIARTYAKGAEAVDSRATSDSHDQEPTG